MIGTKYPWDSSTLRGSLMGIAMIGSLTLAAEFGWLAYVTTWLCGLAGIAWLYRVEDRERFRFAASVRCFDMCLTAGVVIAIRAELPAEMHEAFDKACEAGSVKAEAFGQAAMAARGSEAFKAMESKV